MFGKTAMFGLLAIGAATTAQAENPVNPLHPPVVKATFCDQQSDARFIQNGDGTYSIADGDHVARFGGEIGRSGGRPDGNPAMNNTEGDHEYRVEWLSSERVQLEVWKKGQRAGARRNNPALATFLFYRCAA